MGYIDIFYSWAVFGRRPGAGRSRVYQACRARRADRRWRGTDFCRAGGAFMLGKPMKKMRPRANVSPEQDVGTAGGVEERGQAERKSR